MKNFKIYLAYVALLAMVMTSCSKEDNPDSPDGPAGDEMAVLGFNALLQDFNREMLTKQQGPDLGSTNNELPECSDDPQPDKVQVMLQRLVDDAWEAVKDPSDGDHKIEVPVRFDTNSGTWITDEGANNELELEEGTYRIDYFAVMEGETTIYIAPRENDNYGPAHYGNFVSDALPSEPFLLQKGVKKYVDVEVLCYDDHYVYRYGYLFFDFEEVEILYLCLFGNVCNDNGRHSPAKFRFDVWNYSGDGLNPKGTILYSDTNNWDTYDNGDAYAEPLCVQLPDRAGETDQYYGELWLVDDDGNIIDEDNGPIRLGVFDETDVMNQTWADYDVDESGDSTSNYYHFREGECMSQDDSDPCLFKDIAHYENDFDGDDEKMFISITSIDGNYTNVTTNSPSNASGSGTMQAEGTYGFFSSPSDVHSNWINSLPDTGNMLIINGEDDMADTAPYFVISETEVCPEADYFVTFNLVNVLKDDNGGAANNVDLKVRVNGTVLPGVTITAPYNNGNQQWLKIGLRLKANSSGEFDVRFENAETAANGNDFAIDNVIISNDPSIIDGTEDVTVIQ